MDARRLTHAIDLARRVAHVLVATADRDGLPHLAAARRLEMAGDGRLALSEWFCPGTLANLEQNARISIVAWDAALDVGVQILGVVEQMQDQAVMDGYDPSLASLPLMPQVQKRLIIQPTALLEFTRRRTATARNTRDTAYNWVGQGTPHQGLEGQGDCKMNRYHNLDVIAAVLLIIGGLNWLLVGLFTYNVVSNVFVLPLLVRLIYVAVGIASIYLIARMPALFHVGERTHTPPHAPTI